jgi:hypothetical protein
MTYFVPPRKTSYVGCFGYNDSPEELGEPAGFWQFPDSAKMWSAFVISEDLNDGFESLGEPTYSAILMAADGDGYILFHLLVLSAKYIYPREQELIDAAKAWMLQTGIAWNIPETDEEMPVDEWKTIREEDLPF